MRTALRMTLLVALVAALFSPAPSVAAPPAGCSSSQWFEVYDLEMNSDKKVYRLGDTVTVTVSVTDANTGAPVSDADVSVGAIVRDYWFVNKAVRTDEAGKAQARLRLSRGRMVPGWAELRGFARTYYDQGDPVCAGIGLYGAESKKKAFRIK